MLINAGMHGYSPTNAKKFFVGELVMGTDFNDTCKEVMIEVDPARTWPRSGSKSWLELLFEAGKEITIAEMDAFLSPSKERDSGYDDPNSPDAKVYAYVMSRRIGPETSDRYEYLSQAGPDIADALRFGVATNCNPWYDKLAPAKKTTKDGKETGGAGSSTKGSTLKPFEERYEQAKEWIVGFWVWQYDRLREQDFWRQPDPTTGKELLAGAERSRRGTAWVTSVLHAMAREVMYSAEAYYVVPALNLIKEPFLYELLPETLRQQLEALESTYDPVLPKNMEMGWIHPREAELWTGKGKLYPWPMTFDIGIDLFDTSKIVRRLDSLCQALIDYLEDYRQRRRLYDEADAYGKARQFGEFVKKDAPWHLDTYAQGIKPLFFSNEELSENVSFHDIFCHMMLPVGGETTPVWSTTTWTDKSWLVYDIPGFPQYPSFPVDRSIRDARWSSFGSIFYYRSAKWFCGGEKTTFSPSEVERFVINYSQRDEDSFIQEVIDNWDVITAQSGADEDAFGYGFWEGIEFTSAKFKGGKKPVSVEDYREGKFTGQIFSNDTLSASDMKALVQFTDHYDGTEKKYEIDVRLSRLRIGTKAGLFSEVKEPTTIMRLEPGTPPTNFSFSGTVQKWIDSML